MTLDPLEARVLYALITWTGNADHANWNNAANWSPQQIPGASDDVVINKTDIIRADQPLQQVKTLTSNAALLITKGVFEITGGLVSLGSSATLAIGNSADAGELRFTGTNLAGGVLITGTGDLALASSNAKVTNALASLPGNNDPASKTITLDSGVLTIQTGGTFSVAGDTSRGYDFKGSTSVLGPGTTTYEGQVRIDGTYTSTGAVAVFNNLTNYDPQTRTIAGASFITKPGTSGAKAPGVVVLGNVPAGGISSIGNTLTLASPTSLQTGNAASVLADTLTVNPGATLTYTGGANTLTSLTNNGTLIVSSGVSVNTGTFTTSGTVVVGVSSETDVPIGATVVQVQGGTFNVNLSNSYSPTFGRPFSPIKLLNTAGSPSFSGQFSSTAITPTPTEPYKLTYTATGIQVDAPDLTVVPSTPILRPQDDTGLSDSDDYTSALTTTFTGTAQANAPVSLVVDGTTIATGTAPAGTYSLTGSLAEGVHSVLVKSGQFTSSSRTVTIDRTAPVITASDPTPISNALASGATVTYSASATDTLDPSPVLSYSKASGSLFQLGTTPVTITATDLAGNSSSKTINVVVQSRVAVGNPDITFGGGTGTVTQSYTGVVFSSIDAAPLAGGAGKSLFAALDVSHSSLLIQTLDTDGSLVAGSQHQVSLPQALTSGRVSVDAASNTIYILGTTGTGNQARPAIARVSAAGTLDTTLGASGVLTIPGLASSDVVYTAATVPGKAGGILLGGYIVRDGARTASLMKLTSGGAQITSFGTRGFYQFPAAAGIQIFSSIAVTPKGTIYAAGISSLQGDTASQAILVKLTAAGKRDASLKTNLYSAPGFAQTAATKVLYQNDGKVVMQAAVVTNNTGLSSGAFGSVLFRFTTKGALDTTFARTGIDLVSPPGAPNGLAALTSGFNAAVATAILPASPTSRILTYSLSANTGASTAVVSQTRILSDAFDFTLSNPALPTKKPVKPNTKLTATVTVLNSGSITAPAGASVRAFLLGSNVAIGTSSPLGSVTLNKPLAPGAKVTLKIPITVPTGPGAGGPLYLTLDVNGTATDANNPLGEIDLSNNTATLATPLQIKTT